MTEYVSHSPEETMAFAARFASTLIPGTVVAFNGDLGMGKTCFVKGLAQGLGYHGTVTSPTFALMNEYIGGRLPLYHFDMYRINTWDDLDSSGYFDYVEAGGVVAVEWSEQITGALTDDTVMVSIRRKNDTTRQFIIRRKCEEAGQ